MITSGTRACLASGNFSDVKNIHKYCELLDSGHVRFQFLVRSQIQSGNLGEPQIGYIPINFAVTIAADVRLVLQQTGRPIQTCQASHITGVKYSEACVLAWMSSSIQCL